MGYMQIKKMAEYADISYGLLKKLKREDPNFPKAIHITTKLIVSREEDVDKYIKYRDSIYAGKEA